LSSRTTNWRPPPAVDRGLAYYRGSTRTRTIIRPSDFDQLSIRHFGFFHDRNRLGLWPVTTAWLRDGRIPDSGPTSIVTPALHANELELYEPITDPAPPLMVAAPDGSDTCTNSPQEPALA